MKNSVIFGELLVIALFVLTFSVHAANKAKPQSSSTDAVQELLQSEIVETNSLVDRRGGLNLSTQTDIDAWWQSGYVKSRKQWLPYEESMAAGDEASQLEEYRQLRDKLSDRVHGQWRLANWCRKNGLIDQERVHLLRVLTGGDRSVNMDTVYERLGCKKIDGAWVSEYERREAADLKSEIEQSHKRWDSKFASLVQQLEGSPKQRSQAEQQLAEITQATAVPAIVSTFCLSTQTLAEYGVKMLGQIREYQASRALAGQAVFSPWKPVRTAAIELLKDRKLTEFAPDLLMLLSFPIRTKVESSWRTSPSSVNEVFMAGPNLSVNWDYVWVEETNDKMRVGIRRLFPISVPSNVEDVYSIGSPNLEGRFDTRTGQRVGSPRSNLIVAAELTAQTDHLDFAAEKINDDRNDLNERVGKVLSACTDESMTSDPKEWWKWWALYSDVSHPREKYVEIVDERPNIPSFSRVSVQLSCLVAGTPVWTERGLVAIEQIRAGDRVLSKDVVSGELSYKPVLFTTVREPTRVQQFTVDADTIVASLGHHFWVSGGGWTKMRDLAAKMPMHTVSGMQRISSVEDHGRVEAVYNLVVADFHTYFVGKAMVLSHDVLFPTLTNVKVPGLANR
ncbi:polymorphic toxin-type HINT domain-containing protein [Schlesneria paludicola]|uniref:polymorphic toxin-type HINT domain-containing protein n=1 Tax=Schlesneria paludicola TaxID=360056 RepID=UPI00029AA770|nr:polymorphic toxin-type HINT domain-containing protein [Schlesneria paludicola]